MTNGDIGFLFTHKYPLVTALVLSILIDFVAGGYLF
jgi:hypothetical protein